MPSRPIRPSRWPFLSLIPLGLGAWAPLYAGIKARHPGWTALGAVWTAIALAGWVLNGVLKDSGNSDAVGVLVLISWVGAVATSFTIRGAYDRRMSSPLHVAEEAGVEALRDADHARAIAARDPRLAARMRIGRPDLPGAPDVGLIDVNNASARALATLPGIDDALATRIVETRAEVGGFSSLEDLGTVLDLDGDEVERLRDRTIVLPRA